MEFLVVGLNHRTAPLEVREKLSLSTEGLYAGLKAMESYDVPGAILCTCNRSEFYAMEPGETQRSPVGWGVGDQRIKQFLVDYFDIPMVELDRYLYVYRERDCIRHLFRVVSGLDSMVLGEEQIIGQVRLAFEAAASAGTIAGPLSHLFQHALRVGRRVRRQSGIGRNGLSVSRACVDLAKSRLGGLGSLKAMVVGTGDAGGLAAEVLNLSGVKDITVTNRTYSRAVELANTLSGQAIPFQDMPQALGSADLVIASTGSPGYVLEANMVRHAMVGRPDRPLFLMDIAVPRDIDPAAGLIDNVFLHDVDDLNEAAEARRQDKAREVQWAEELVEEEVLELLDWCRIDQARPTVIALRDKAEKIRKTELIKTIRKLQPDLSPEQQAALEAMSRSIVKKMLHGPTVYLKGRRNSSDFLTAREIFQIPGEDT